MSRNPTNNHAWFFACRERFVFGKNGKPLYFQGPHDSPVKIRHVLSTLQRICGEGNFEAVLTGTAGGALMHPDDFEL